jgi:hypothetical protein
VVIAFIYCSPLEAKTDPFFLVGVIQGLSLCNSFRPVYHTFHYSVITLPINGEITMKDISVELLAAAFMSGTDTGSAVDAVPSFERRELMRIINSRAASL